MNNPTFADLHIHIGRTQTGKPVKITGSKTLTLTNILEEASERKGLDMIGIIDCHVPEVLSELRQLVEQERATVLTGGGIRYQSTTLILGSEIEINDEYAQGPLHLLCYLPTLEAMTAFSAWMAGHQKNITLSSQRLYVTARELQRMVKEFEGLFIPAHIFTPFKSLYGKGVKSSLEEVLDPVLIDAVELGLSSNTLMADQLPELHTFTYVSNSDAHSLAKIGREYQRLVLDQPDFIHLGLALQGQKEQKIAANYGLDPKLGKYHEEVSQRLEELANLQQYASRFGNASPPRPPYIHQVPLEYIPGLGPKGLERLLDHFGTEMNVLHAVQREHLEEVLRPEVVHSIIQAREGSLIIEAGGGGKYGKVSYLQ